MISDEIDEPSLFLSLYQGFLRASETRYHFATELWNIGCDADRIETPAFERVVDRKSRKGPYDANAPGRQALSSNMTAADYPEWQAHLAPFYDDLMNARCEEIMQALRADNGFRQEVRTNPRVLHKLLFEQFTPPNFAEYAGTYRGTPGTSLEGRVAAAKSVVDGEVYKFVPPSDVLQYMDAMAANVAEFVKEASDHQQRLTALSWQFAWIGKIHPFLDGNGHLQRALFAALALELGYELSSRFAIHPRPFGRLFAVALEMFARAPNGTSTEQLDLVSEYLDFFIER
jgi:fido (protein-threonine AMPylation protein)